MRVFFPLLCSSILFFSSCSMNNKNIPAGIWKLEKIEILRNNELKKIIDTGYQYWKFYNSDSIEISNTQQVQKCLRIKAGRDSFRSIDNASGNMIDEFFIEKHNKHELEIYSKNKLDKVDYTVVYYLEKVIDTIEGDKEKQ